MKLTNFFASLACFLGFIMWASGSQVDSKTAAAMTKGWLQSQPSPLGSKLGNKVKNVETFKDSSGSPLYHVVNLEPSGFVIVAAEDQVEPIIAFASQGHFDSSEENPLGALVNRDLPQRVTYARKHTNTAAGLKNHGKWQKLLSSAASSNNGVQANALNTGAISDIRVAPLLATSWNQGASDNTSNGPACYNYFTPPHDAGCSSNALCGCVATAMAQLIYYYQYPSTGVGTPSFNISFDGNPIRWPWPLRGGDGKGGPYDWADMPLDPINATPVQCAAIGALTYDAGVAVHMQYSDTVSGSTASLNDAQTALLTTFKYANAIITEASTINVGFDLQDMINPNLDAHRPVVFGIDNLIGGHCIVCDGYGYSTETLYHHLNMGWGGADNAWYHLPLIDLADEAPYYNFDTCLYNIFTNGSGEIISGRVLDTNGMPVPGASVTGYGSQGSIFTATTDNNGIYALTGVPSTSTCAVIVTNVGYYPVTTNIVTLLSDDNGTNCGNVWGVNFTLVPAQGPPAFDIQPKNQTVIIGSNAIFIANASGQLPLSYQWQYQPSGSLNWVNINDDDINSGAQTATLTITPKDTAINGEPLQCVAINPLGSTNSFQVILTVTPVPSQFIPIATLAGMAGTSGSVDGLSTNALFGNPHGIAIDNHTNIFIADRNNHVIRKMYSSGAAWSVTTIAGSAGNYGTNDGSGTNARFNGPYGVSVDNSGNVFVADTGNHAIRKLTPSGTNWMVSTIAGLAGSSGSANGSNAGFKFPMGISMDNSGNIYVADEGNHDIRKLTPIGTNWTVSTIAGSTNSGFNDGTNSSAQFGQPFGITVNNNGTVFVADQYYNTIRQLTPSGANWVVTTIAGLGGSSGSADGTGSGVRFYNPTGIAAGADGNLYVADYGNNTVRRMTLSGTNWIVATVAGLPGSSGSIDGVGSSVRFNGPFGIAVDNNTNVYVSDANNNTIRGAALTSTPNPVVIHLEKQSIDNSFEVTWNALVGKIYQVQFKTNLNQVDWINLTTTTATNWTGSALVPVGTDPQRFYRVVSQ